jgi:hypothetical protein
MSTATRSSGSLVARRCQILLGYNLPFLLWTLYAATGAVISGVSLWLCPIHPIAGWCPGCGLTRQYIQLLRGDSLPTLWGGLVLATFVLNVGCSIVRASRVLPEAVPETPGGSG